MNTKKWEKYYLELDDHLAERLVRILTDKHCRVKLEERAAQPVHPHFQMEKHWAKSRRTVLLHPEDAPRAKKIIEQFLDDAKSRNSFTGNSDLSQYAKGPTVRTAPTAPAKPRPGAGRMIALIMTILAIAVIMVIALKP